MTERHPTLKDALDLARALQDHCQQLRMIGDDHTQMLVEEIQRLVDEILSELDRHKDNSV